VSSCSLPTAICSTPSLGTTPALKEFIKTVDIFFDSFTFAIWLTSVIAQIILQA
jgi:hypothetical protein